MELESLDLTSHRQLEKVMTTRPDKILHVTGCHSPMALAPLIAETFARGLKRPLVIVLTEEQQIQQLAEDVLFFNPDFKYTLLPGFDVSPYANLYPSPRIVGQRLRWLFEAYRGTTQKVFFASINGLLQNTLPFHELKAHSFKLKKQTEITENLSERLHHLGYYLTPVVEDVGTFSIKGGIIDIFSPAHEQPFRIELFADTIEEIKFFDPDTQLSLHSIDNVHIIPAKEVLFKEDRRLKTVDSYKKLLNEDSEKSFAADEVIQSLAQAKYFHGIEFLLPCFYDKLEGPLEHFSDSIDLWMCQPSNMTTQYDHFLADLKTEYELSKEYHLRVKYTELFNKYDELLALIPPESTQIYFENILINDQVETNEDHLIEYSSYSLEEFRNNCRNFFRDKNNYNQYVSQKLNQWRDLGYSFFVSAPLGHQRDKLKHLLRACGYQPIEVEEDQYLWNEWCLAQQKHLDFIHLLPHSLNHSYRLPNEKHVFFRDDDFLGQRKQRLKSSQADQDKKAFQFDFSELKTGDLIVHKLHGVGVFDGLKVMDIDGISSEFVQLSYKDKDKLYLPIYRIHQIQKFSGPQGQRIIDKLGGTQWEKTKNKVKKHLRDMAAELLKLYAARAEAVRPAFSYPDDDYIAFENTFPFEETVDQAKAISDVLSDMASDKPMDRLICGDVGFGKTEVALRAAFKCVEDGRQVCLIAPTTILTFQHYQNFKKRMKNWPVTIKPLNRFVPKTEVKQTLEELKEGKVDIVIGTHRLLSKDVEFKKLGLLIIDEEQKFGVKHKEKIRQVRKMVDTLTMSATPIPRTLNMSLVGIRDLSLINTAPIDRLPTRTFICRFDKETIRKAIESELQRGGQVFFLHNRVQSIEALASELRQILPKVRLGIGHGQMEEHQLEKTMISFFNKEIDVLLCTTIIESGMDIPNANTMFIDNAHQLGLSQLYQLRGRVGRGKERAYCYLIVPNNKKLDKEAQERLRIIQENTALGSGIRIAQHDLELRGAGDFLGEEQSGHINAIGYEMYMELLENAIREQKGEPIGNEDVDPEINLKIPALIPDDYIPDIRVRLNYYKALSQIISEEDLDHFEQEIHDQYGKLPEPLINLMGLMLIKSLCKELKIKDLTQSRVGVSLTFYENNKLNIDEVLRLCQKENKKYSLTPDSRLVIRLKEVTWPRVLEELNQLPT
ncbi:MAG: transcription-repair coupling factor [Bdellovibrionales bacterium]|nr:transcription-repair coupling factor [Bdellovibrionales bacterium]